MDIFESFKQTQAILNRTQLSPAAMAFASMPSSLLHQQFEQINGLSEALTYATKNAFLQTEQIAQVFRSSEVQMQLEQVNRMTDTIIRSTQIANLQLSSAMDFMKNPAVQSQLRQISQMGKVFEQINNPAFSQITKVLDAYRSPALQQQLESFQLLSQTTLSAMSHAIKTFDLSDIQFNDNGTLVYEGVEYSQEAIAEELSIQVQEVQKSPSSLKQCAEKLQEKFWLLFLVVQLLVFLPQLPETIEFYQGFISQIWEAINNENQTCYVIKERAYIRMEANAKAEIIATVVYDTPLEVLDTIPRWYHVKSIGENGEEQIGWVSKISVETEEQSNDQ